MTHRNPSTSPEKTTMAAAGRVKVTGILSSVSGTPVEPGKTYPFSPLDHAMGLHHLRAVFYYRSAEERDRLKDSLTLALSSYPPITGRLRRDAAGNWEVKCSDAGLRLVEARVAGTLDDWLSSATAADERHLTYWMPMPEDPFIWSPYYIQINEFEGGGTAIGVSWTHMHADPTCATCFLRAWSDTHRDLAITAPPFFHPPGLRARQTPNTATATANYYQAKSKASPPYPSGKMLTATFRFSASAVTNLLSDCPGATPFDALAALFWVSTTKRRRRDLAVCIDFRRRMHAPLPRGFYGNAVHFSKVPIEGEAVADVGHVAGIIHNHLMALPEEEFWSGIEWFESRRDENGRFPAPVGMYGPELTCVNMEALPVYEVAFDKEAKPLHVGYYVEEVAGEGVVVVLPSPDGGLGRTVTATLPEEVMMELYRDEGLLRLQPAVLLADRS